MLHLRNTSYAGFLTLTFPYPVKDDREAKSALERIGLWLVRRGVSFYWKVEFRDGRPHFHLLTTKLVNKDELAVAWGGVVDVEHVVVYSEAISDQEATIRYVAKRCEDEQNQVPKDYRNMGRFWGTRGPDAVARAHLVVEGNPESVAKAIRPLKKLEKQKKGRSRSDPGHVGMTLTDVGGPEVAEALKKVLKSNDAV